MGNDADIELMLRFGKGDKEAFERLYLSYRTRVINFCYRFFSDRGMAEDVCQEVFMRVYKAGARYRPDAEYSTWLFKIATNVCLNELRKRKYKSIFLSIDDNEGKRGLDIPDPSPESLTRIEEREKKKSIMAAIRSLPGKQRAAILLREYQGFSYADIAQQLGCSESSVKSLIFRGRNQLKKRLEPELREES